MFFESENCLQRASKSLSSPVRVNASKMSSSLCFVGHFLHSEEEKLFGIEDLNDKRVSVLEVTRGKEKLYPLPCSEQETIFTRRWFETVFQQKLNFHGRCEDG